MAYKSKDIFRLFGIQFGQGVIFLLVQIQTIKDVICEEGMIQIPFYNLWYKWIALTFRMCNNQARLIKEIKAEL